MERKTVQHITMKELPKGEQPFEKCKVLGPEFLSDEELLAVIFRSGTTDRRVTEMTGEILAIGKEFGGISNLSRIPLCRLKQVKGVGDVRAVQIQCICEFGRRMQRSEEHLDKIEVNKPEILVNYMKSFLTHLQTEELWAVFLDGKNRILIQKCMSKGDFRSSQVSVREIFKTALQSGAVSLILIHNHPSDIRHPSKADIDVTLLIRDAGRIIGIELLDHIIVCSNSYFSMREEKTLQF